MTALERLAEHIFTKEIGPILQGLEEGDREVVAHALVYRIAVCLRWSLTYIDSSDVRRYWAALYGLDRDDLTRADRARFEQVFARLRQDPFWLDCGWVDENVAEVFHEEISRIEREMGSGSVGPLSSAATSPEEEP